jgi:8-oxo-dGTP diphosphatase
MIYIAGVLLKKDNKYLLVQEKKLHVYGQWNVPAGRVEKGETLEETAKREGEEETGLRLKLGKEIFVTPGNSPDKEVHIFTAEILGGEIHWDEEELLDVRWFTTEEIKQLHLRLEALREILD